MLPSRRHGSPGPHATDPRTTPGNKSRHETRQALLDAAEELFAEHGIDGTSLRAITRRAGANVAAIHYYFGSKEGLVQEVFARRLAPLADERLARLAACGEPGEESLQPGEDHLECILRAFVEPFVELGWRMDHGSSAPHLSGRLMAQVINERGDFLRGALAAELRETFERFGTALARAVPHLDREELIARFNFAIGTLVHSVGGIRLFAEEDAALERSDALVDRLVAFLVAGFRAPACRGRPPPMTGPDPGRSDEKRTTTPCALEPRPLGPGWAGGARMALVPLVSLLPLLAMGCAGLRVHRPAQPDGAGEALAGSVELPPAWTAARGAASERPPVAEPPPETRSEPWWRSFGDPHLSRLIGESLAGSFDLAAAAARVEAAQARARIAGADLSPQADLSVSGSRARRNFIGFPIPGAGERVLSTTNTSWGVSLNLSWEVDLWGRIRSGRSAAGRTVDAARADLAGAALSLSGQTAKAYFAVLEARQQAALARGTLENRRTNEERVRRRYEAGLTNALDLRLARAERASAESALAARRQALDGLERQLETLLVRYPARRLESLPERLPDLSATASRMAPRGASPRCRPACRPRSSPAGPISPPPRRAWPPPASGWPRRARRSTRASG